MIPDGRHEILGPVVDREHGAEPDAGSAFLRRSRRRDRDGPERARKLNRGRADPAGTAVNEYPLARLQPATIEQIGPDREERLRNRGRVLFRYRRGDPQALFRGDGAVFRVAAAGHQRAHVLADCQRVDAVHSHDLAAHLEAGNVGGPGGRGVFAHPLHDVGTIDAGGRDADEHFTGARLWNGTGGEPQHLGAARAGDFDRVH